MINDALLPMRTCKKRGENLGEEKLQDSGCCAQTRTDIGSLVTFLQLASPMINDLTSITPGVIVACP